MRQTGEPVFSDLAANGQPIRDDPDARVQTLLQIRDVTVGWLHEVAKQHGIGVWGAPVRIRPA